jgi:competence protein ComEC
MRYFIWIFLILIVIFRFIIFYSNQFTYTDGTYVRVTDRVLSEPIRYTDSQYFRLSGFKIYLPLYPEVHYRDEIVVEGKVDKNKLKNVKLIEVRENRGLLSNFRNRLLDVYQENLSGENAALVSGVTLGSKGDISTEFWNKLKVTGTAHVVVASGFNVSLVANFLINFFILFLPRRRALYFALAGIWIYSILSGFDAPIVRAAIMGSIGFSAQAMGRVYDAWRGLFLSALGMLVYRPDWLTDLGFILSFFATASIMLFERRINKKAQFIPKIIREDFSTSFAAQIGVFPILFVSFGQFNMLSPLINTVVLWTIVPITIIGMIGGIVGMFIPLLGRLILFVTFPLTGWFIGVVQFFGQS